MGENNKNTSAAVYLADDDNTYDERLFQEFVKIGRNNKTIMGVLPVGLVGGGSWEGPICKDGQVKGYHSLYKPTRTFALDGRFRVHRSSAYRFKRAIQPRL